MKSIKARNFIKGRIRMGSSSFSQADVENCVLFAEREAEERVRDKAHKIIKKMMEAVFQGDMPQKIADELTNKLNEE